mgnify:CR=1 FL=1
MGQAASLPDFAAKPLVVLTAGTGSDATHLASQNDLATLSTTACIASSTAPPTKR